MDWLKEHMHEVILPNLQGDLQELTGIQLDESLGEFKIVAEPLDEEDEDCEEFEITIILGDLILVDACFLLEEVESGTLPLCKPEEELTQDIIQAKLKALREQVIPLLREEFASELAENQWDPKLAMLLNIVPEVLDANSGMRSSGGYPPVMLVFRHPEYDPDAFEVSTRIDPMAQEEWVDWKTFMPSINTALKGIGEEQSDGLLEPTSQEDGDDPDREPSPEDLAEDDEISTIEEDALGDAPPPETASDSETELSGNLLASLEASLGIKLTKKRPSQAKAESSDAGKKPAKKASKKAAKKAPAKKTAKKAAKKTSKKK